MADEDFPAGDLGAADVEATRQFLASERDVSVKVVAAINSMNKRGHDVPSVLSGHALVTLQWRAFLRIEFVVEIPANI